MVQRYEIREAEGKGVGCFAVQEAKLGSIVMEEKPLICVRTSPKHCMKAFESLSSHEKMMYLSLHGSDDKQQYLTAHRQTSPPTASTNKTPGQDTLKQIQNRILELEILAMTEDAFIAAYMNDQITIDAALDRLAQSKSDLNAKVKDIYNTNCFSISAAASSQRNPSGGLVNFEISRINHACIPNAEFVWSHGTKTSRIYAVKDIAAGEEIVISYLDAYLDTAERSMELRAWDFECSCPACDLNTEFGRTSNWRRSRLRQLNDCVLEHFDNPGGSPFEDDEQALEATSKLVDLLNEEGLIGFEAVHLRRAGDLCLENGELDNAIEWYQRLVNVAKIHEGMDFFGAADAIDRLVQLIATRNQVLEVRESPRSDDEDSGDD